MGEKITPACTSEKGSAERRRNAFSRALMKGVGRNTRGPAWEGSPWGAHRGGCTVGHSSGPQRGRWSRALASGARVVSMWYQGGTTLLPVRYQPGNFNQNRSFECLRPSGCCLLLHGMAKTRGWGATALMGLILSKLE